MPRVRPQLGLVFALLVPQLARADQFRPPEDKSAVEVSITIENLDAHPGYLFVLWPDACLVDSDDLATYTVLNSDDDDGRTDFVDYYGSCHTQRLFAFPSDAYTAVDGVLTENGLRQLGDDSPSDPRVLVEKIEAEQRWWVPYEVNIEGIEDVYRVGIESGVLTLTPTRVRFDLGNGHIFDRAFYKGRRPRLPREEDIRRLVPQDPAAPAPASDEAPAEAKPEPTLAAAAEAKAEPAPPPSPPAPTSTSAPPSSPTPAPASDKPAGEISATPWPPPPLLYGGACLLVAVAAGVALRRRR
ncbi:hypothetical protein OV090_19475 [Nannocystis sp. RBIL2]|uniref:hypothetical protein n=1 Tax=Nannocystis sp. RBIL2 TaxID=2996788 RepID=UPI0022714BEA|nr:hypothetical protein [Nannocystis sp. RBIL2]MCY1066961.1 hypothetical protein [Nannocystis sp. RBIL2]